MTPQQTVCTTERELSLRWLLAGHSCTTLHHATMAPWQPRHCLPQFACSYSLLAPTAAAASSPQLRKALEAVLGQPGAVAPQRARFFRGQMQTIISKALNDVGIKPLPSRRCFSIMSEWRQPAAWGRCRRGHLVGGKRAGGGDGKQCREAAGQPDALGVQQRAAGQMHGGCSRGRQ